MLDKVIHNRDGWRRDEDDVSDTVVETCGRRSCTQCRKGGRTVLPLSGINRSDPLAHGSFSHKTWKSIPRDATRAVRRHGRLVCTTGGRRVKKWARPLVVRAFSEHLGGYRGKTSLFAAFCL